MYTYARCCALLSPADVILTNLPAGAPMAGDSLPYVTVILPACNASATIHETLQSIRSQTYGNLEIIVVDDGSVDGTAAITKRHVDQDDRVRLLSCSNSGVARARNLALASASGALVAPIDADDLWRPDKIERQVALLLERGPAVSLVYTWYAVIDEKSRVLQNCTPTEEGRVVRALLLGNFIGHASSPLMRTRDVIGVGGYDPTLRARRAEGCEDLDLYLRMAALGEFAAVKSVLTGYRDSSSNMSSNYAQMLRSHAFVVSAASRLYPGFAREIRDGRANQAIHFLKRALASSRYNAAIAVFLQICARDPGIGARLLFYIPALLRRASGRIWRRRARSRTPATLPHFLADLVFPDSGDTSADPAFDPDSIQVSSHYGSRE